MPIPEDEVAIRWFAFQAVTKCVGVEPGEALGGLAYTKGPPFPVRAEDVVAIDRNSFKPRPAAKVVGFGWQGLGVLVWGHGRSLAQIGHDGPVHPLSTLLLLLGYGLALPIGARFRAIARKQSRVAFTGHQVGVGVATLGWAFRASLGLVVAHLVWLFAARLLFAWGQRERD